MRGEQRRWAGQRDGVQRRSLQRSCGNVLLFVCSEVDHACTTIIIIIIIHQESGDKQTLHQLRLSRESCRLSPKQQPPPPPPAAAAAPAHHAQVQRHDGEHGGGRGAHRHTGRRRRCPARLCTNSPQLWRLTRERQTGAALTWRPTEAQWSPARSEGRTGC